METYVVRMWLPDRPGALGQVASRIGAVRGEIVGIEILERGGGRAIDELVVDLPEPGLAGPARAGDPAGRRRRRGGDPARRRRPPRPPARRPGDGGDPRGRHRPRRAHPGRRASTPRRAVGAEWAAVVELEDGEVLAAEGPVPAAGLARGLRRGQPVLGPGGRRREPGPTTSCGRRCRRSAWPSSSVATAPPYRARERRQVAALARIVDTRLREIIRYSSHPQPPLRADGERPE